MDKKTPTTLPAEQQSLFDQTGDMLGHLGDALTNAKDTVVGFVTEEAVIVLLSIKSIQNRLTPLEQNWHIFDFGSISNQKG